MSFSTNDLMGYINLYINRLNAFRFYLKLFFSKRKKVLNLNQKEQYLLYKRAQRVNPIPFIEKQTYMISDEWKLMQKIWLHEIGYRCQMFPFIILGKHGAWGKSYYGNYAIHHTTRKSYENLGKEVLNIDVIVLSKFAHESIFHYIYSFGKKKVRDQKVLRFANPLQIAGNYWCKLNLKFKLISVICVVLVLL